MISFSISTNILGIFIQASKNRLGVHFGASTRHGILKKKDMETGIDSRSECIVYY